MDGPVYKLEQVVHSREGLEDFEGPLDLILFLLSKNKIEIQDIPIALILDQYLGYLALRREMDLEVASEFITMASQLMFIKTRMLLDLEDEEAQSEMAELIRSLEERRQSEDYAKIRYVTAQLDAMGEFGRSILVKGPEPVDKGRPRNYDHMPEDLVRALEEIADRDRRRLLPPLSSFAEIVQREPYPVGGKAKELLTLLRRGVASFQMLFRGCRSRSEVVAAFLALLELCKARAIRFTGSETDCVVTLTGQDLDGLQL